MSKIAIPDGSLWGYDSDKIVFTGGALQLEDQRTLYEDFSETIDSDIWGTHLSASGSIVEDITDSDDIVQFSRLRMNKGSSTDLATLFWKMPIDDSAAFKLKMAMESTYENLAGISWMISGFDGLPIANSLGNYRLFFIRRNANEIDITYRNNAGVTYYWNTGTSAWQTPLVSAGLAHNVFRWWYLISDGTSWRIRIEDAVGTLIFETTPVTWALTQPLVGAEENYLVFNDNRNSTAQLDVELDSVNVWPSDTNEDIYSTASDVATSPWFGIDQSTLDAAASIAIQLILAGVSSVLFRYALDGDAFSGSFLTPAQLLTALNAQPITDHTQSMRLQMQFNSNGTDQARALLPETFVQADAVISDSPAEDNVRLGTAYDEGTKTGTLAVPSPNDVRLPVPTDDTTGTYVPALEADVLKDVQFGALGVEFTGELVPLAATYECNEIIILEDSEVIIFEGCE